MAKLFNISEPHFLHLCNCTVFGKHLPHSGSFLLSGGAHTGGAPWPLSTPCNTPPQMRGSDSAHGQIRSAPMECSRLRFSMFLLGSEASVWCIVLGSSQVGGSARVHHSGEETASAEGAFGSPVEQSPDLVFFSKKSGLFLVFLEVR